MVVFMIVLNIICILSILASFGAILHYAFGQDKDDKLATTYFLLFVLSFVFAYQTAPNFRADNNQYKRSIQAESDFVVGTDKARLKQAYAKKRVWAIYDREMNAFERAYTLEEVTKRRKELKKEDSVNTRLYIELETK